jgi:hypothetical protein
VILRPDTGGTSVLELFTEVLSLVDGDTMALTNVQERVASVLAGEQCEAGEHCYDRSAADEECRFYLSCDVPQLPDILPAGVSDVKYLSNLEGCSALTNDEMADQVLWAGGTRRTD